MAELNKLLISKFFALLLVFLLLYGPFSYADNAKNLFQAGLEAYNHGAYNAAVEKFELLLNINEPIYPELKAKTYLLLGAGFEKTGRLDAAKDTFLQLKKMLDQGVITKEPALAEVDTASLTAYREVFEEKSFFEFKKPTTVTEMMKKNVVHAPRKSIEQKEKEKKKKKFPWLIAVGAVVVLGTAAVLLLTTKSKDKKVFHEIEWIKIPAGEFLMGDNFNEGENDELPVHKVYLDEYYISKYEITGRQYADFCEATNRPWPYDFERHPFPGRDNTWNCPVVAVSWGDAQDFCGWLSKVTGENIRLPTEAQWEKAARGALQYRYPWGNDPPDNSRRGGILSEVGSFPAGASPYGVHDMAGSAAEWCRDIYSAFYYSVSPKQNPTGPAGGASFVVRGGNGDIKADDIRSANRDFHQAAYTSSYIGFRVVKEK